MDQVTIDWREVDADIHDDKIIIRGSVEYLREYRMCLDMKMQTQRHPTEVCHLSGEHLRSFHCRLEPTTISVRRKNGISTPELTVKTHFIERIRECNLKTGKET